MITLQDYCVYRTTVSVDLYYCTEYTIFLSYSVEISSCMLCHATYRDMLSHSHHSQRAF